MFGILTIPRGRNLTIGVSTASTAPSTGALRIVTNVRIFETSARTAGPDFRKTLILPSVAKEVLRTAIRTLRTIRVGVEHLGVSI